MRVAIFGGSFNPPHVGHVLAASYVRAVAPVERILVVPVFQHPFLKSLAPFEDRVIMCELAFAHIRDVEVSRVEAELETPSLTVRTLEHLHRVHPRWELCLVVGEDVLGDAANWHAWDRVVELAPLFVVGRRGAEGGRTHAPALPEVSSSELRDLLKERTPEADLSLEAQIPAAVLAHARARGIYR